MIYNELNYWAIMIFFTEKLPSQVQMQSTRSLIECGIELGHIMADYSLYGHRDVSNTDCPGDLFYNEELVNWPNKQTLAPQSYTEKMD